jgi:hypothetical protein
MLPKRDLMENIAHFNKRFIVPHTMHENMTNDYFVVEFSSTILLISKERFIVHDMMKQIINE